MPLRRVVRFSSAPPLFPIRQHDLSRGGRLPSWWQVRQQKREVDLAVKLVTLLQPLIDAETDEGRAQVEASLHSEAVELANLSFGDCLLFVVAELYTCRAEVTTGLWAGGCGTVGALDGTRLRHGWDTFACIAQEFVGMNASFLGVDGHLAAWKGKRLSMQNHAAAAGAGFRAVGAAFRSIKTVKEIAEKVRGIVWDCVGLCGIVWDRVGSRGIAWDRVGSRGIVWGVAGLL